MIGLTMKLTGSEAPDLADVFIWRGATEGLKTAYKVVIPTALIRDSRGIPFGSPL